MLEICQALAECAPVCVFAGFGEGAELSVGEFQGGTKNGWGHKWGHILPALGKFLAFMRVSAQIVRVAPAPQTRPVASTSYRPFCFCRFCGLPATGSPQFTGTNLWTTRGLHGHALRKCLAHKGLCCTAAKSGNNSHGGPCAGSLRSQQPEILLIAFK